MAAARNSKIVAQFFLKNSPARVLEVVTAYNFFEFAEQDNRGDFHLHMHPALPLEIIEEFENVSKGFPTLTVHVRSVFSSRSVKVLAFANGKTVPYIPIFHY